MSTSCRLQSCIALLLLALGALCGTARAQVGIAARRPTPAYVLTWSATLSDDAPDPILPGVRHITDRSSSGTARLELVGVAAGRVSYMGHGTVTAHNRDVVAFPELRQELDVSATSAASVNPGEVHFNLVKNTYTLGFPSTFLAGEFRIVTPQQTITQQVNNQSFQVQPQVEIPVPPGGAQGVIQFTGTVQLAQDQNFCRSMQLTYTLTPGPPPKLLLKQTPFDFLPTEDGMASTVEGKVVQVGIGGSPVPIRFHLSEITQEPGTCLNKADTAPTDLSFEALENVGQFKEPVAQGSNGWSIETLTPGTSATVTILSQDFGGWGKLRAEAFYNGKWNPIPAEKSKLGYVTVPFDANNNKIADRWEKDNRFKGSPSSDLDKLPRTDGKPGDGLTAYEEYRGLFAKDQHKRLDPNTKELVIRNRIGDDAEPGINFFGSASGLKPVIVNDSELPESRIVNANTSGLNHAGDQYGVILSDDDLGGEIGKTFTTNPEMTRPKNTLGVFIDTGAILGESIRLGIPYDGYVNYAIAHELSHSVGVDHHGDTVPIAAKKELGPGDVPPTYTVLDTSGSPITQRPFTLTGPLGSPGNEASGDTGCLQCYVGGFAWCVDPAAGPRFTITKVPQWTLPTRFCGSSKGTGINAKGKYFGDAHRGNCIGQIHPKDY